MMPHLAGRRRRRQAGVALIAVLALIVLGALWWFLSTVGTGLNSQTAAMREHNAKVLSVAKQALIGHVAHRVNYPATPLTDREAHPGRLPCPEADGYIGTSNEGVAASFCSVPAVGRLPWKTLGLDKLVDASNEPLWYVVSPGWTLPFSTATLELNSNTAGALTLDAASNAAAALIIAPGGPLVVEASTDCVARTQVRSAPAPGMDFRDYLECQNATSAPDLTFATAGPFGSFNDQVLAVTATDVWAVVEGAVAARFERDVLPVLQTLFGSTYASAQWGTSASTPILPFAAPFANSSTSSFQGSAGSTQGLLPLSRSQSCNPATDEACDPDFVRWVPATVNVVKRSGTADITSASCTASTASSARCTVSYSRTCSGIGCLFGCACPATLELSLLARAENVGMVLREFTTSGITGFTATPTAQTPLGADGASSVDVRGNVPSDSCTAWVIFGVLFPCTASNTATVDVPIQVFADPPSLSALFASGSASEWFTQNKWHHVFLYAVAPSHTASSVAHDCRSSSPTADCLLVNGGTTPPDMRAMVGMAGQSLAGLARPSADLADYLDSATNRDGDVTFEQRMSGRRFNDRFFPVSQY